MKMNNYTSIIQSKDLSVITTDQNILDVRSKLVKVSYSISETSMSILTMDPDEFETHLKTKLARAIADKLIQDNLISFTKKSEDINGFRNYVYNARLFLTDGETTKRLVIMGKIS